jgi:hypothetical protein
MPPHEDGPTKNEPDKAFPWLEGFDADRGEAFEQLLAFLCRPAFGSRSKREVELEVVRILYERRVRAGTLTIGEVADALAISRSKARDTFKRSGPVSSRAKRPLAVSRSCTTPSSTDRNGGRLSTTRKSIDFES